MLINEIHYKVIRENKNVLSIDEKLGSRLICMEYSANIEERKTFPSKVKGDVFALYWMTDDNGKFYSSMIPSEQKIIYTREIIDGQKTQLHTHDYIELGYVIEGECKQKILGKDIKFKKGELFLIDKNCVHQDYIFRSNSAILFIGMSNEMFDEIILERIGEERISNFLRQSLLKQKNTLQYLHFYPKESVDKSKIEEDLLMLIRELGQNDEASKYITKGIMMRILTLISTEYIFSLSIEQKNKMTSFIVEEIKDYINNNYSNITIKDLVKKFNFNEDYFNRILKQKEGMTYSEYVQSIRLKKAVQLLVTTEKSIEDIVRIVGYNNKGYFYKIFVSKYGMTPAIYRKTVKKK